MERKSDLNSNDVDGQRICMYLVWMTVGACASSPGQFQVPQPPSTLFLRQNLSLHLKLISLAELALFPNTVVNMYPATSGFYRGTEELNSSTHVSATGPG